MKTKKTNSTANIDRTNSEAGSLIGFIIMTLLALVFTSCSDDDSPRPDTRALFVGTYDVTDISAKSGNVYEYIMTITSGAKGIEISNFGDILNVPIKADVNGNNFTIPKQTFKNPSGKVLEVSAKGTISGNVITFDYILGGYMDYTGNCTANRIDD